MRSTLFLILIPFSKVTPMSNELMSDSVSICKEESNLYIAPDTL